MGGPENARRPYIYIYIYTYIYVCEDIWICGYTKTVEYISLGLNAVPISAPTEVDEPYGSIGTLLDARPTWRVERGVKEDFRGSWIQLGMAGMIQFSGSP